MNRRLLLLLMACILTVVSQAQINITSFRVKSSLPAAIPSWPNEPSSVLLVATKIPLQKTGPVKLVIQIRNSNGLVCGRQAEQIKVSDSSFTLRSYTAKDIAAMLPPCADLAPGDYQLHVQFFNEGNKAISKESFKPFRVGGPPASATSAACTNVQVAQSAGCHGTTADGSPAYATNPVITNNSGQVISSWEITSTDVTLLSGGNPVTVYTGTPATLNTGANNIPAILFSNPAPMPIYFNYKFNFADGSSCTSKVAVDYSPCAPACTCSAWPQQITYHTSATSGSPTSSFTITNGGTITLTNSQYLSFPNLVTPGCSNNCSASLSFEIYGLNGNRIGVTGSIFDAGTLFEQPCSNTGRYKIVIKAKCGTTSCSDFVIWVNKPCPTCQCTGFPQVFIRRMVNNQPQLTPFSCTAPVYINQLSCNKPDSLVVRNNCAAGCNSNAGITITRPDGTSFTLPVSQIQNNESWFIIPASGQSGLYKFEISSSCGNQSCSICRISFQQNCTPVCQIPDITLQNQTICTGSSASIGVPAVAGITCSWVSVPAGFTSSLSNPTVNPSVTTIYTLTRTSSNPNCPPKINSVTVTVQPCCPPGCTVKLTVKDLLTNQTRVCRADSITILNCGQTYEFARFLNCNPANNTVQFRQVNVANSLGQPVPWAANFVLAGATGSITIPANVTPGVYTITYTWGTSTMVCGSVNYQFEIRCVPPACTCGGWEKTSASYQWNTVSYNNSPVDCNKGIQTNCNQPVSINGNFSCNGNCTADKTYTIYKPDGTVLSNGSGFPVVFTPGMPSATPYKVVLKGRCGGKVCDSCIIYVTPVCKPDCKCGKWGRLTYRGSNQTYPCNSSITIPCNKMFRFYQTLSCTGNADSCTAGISWKIMNGNSILAQGTGTNQVSGSFTPTQNGIYVLIFSGTCNGKVCPETCSYKLVVNNCCDSKQVKVFSANGNPVPDNIQCLNPGKYSFNLMPPIPAVNGSYTMISTPDGAVISTGGFSAGTPINLTVPAYVCGSKTGIQLTFKWGECKTVYVKPICESCCTEIVFQNGTTHLNGNNIDFSASFNTAVPSVSFNKIKVQILRLNGPGNITWPNANILTLKINPQVWNGDVSQAITTPGSAIWFTNPPLNMTVNGPFTFDGQLINISPATGPINLQLRFTFYQVNGTCQQLICEKEISL